MTPDQWRLFRLVRGTYGQRQADGRADAAREDSAGRADGDQLGALADVGERYSRGFGHITTRQNVQFHFVKLHDVEPAMRRLAEAGLTTREACGNSVRNITACPYAGVAADERFDVTPYAEALTRYLLRHPLSSTLPRKFKIAFEGCPEDHVAPAINDLGFRARARPRRRPRLPRHCRRRHGDHADVGGRAARVPARLRDPPRRGGGAARVRALRRLPAQAAEPHEVHDQDARLGALARGIRPRARRAAVCAARCRRSTSIRRRPRRGRTGSRESSPSVGYVASRVAAGPMHGPGHHAGRSSRCSSSSDEAYARWRTTNVRPQKQFGYRRWRRRRCRSAISRASRCACSASSRARTATARCASRRIRICVFRWVNASRRAAAVSPARRRRASAWPRRRRSPTSRAAPAPSRAGSR